MAITNNRQRQLAASKSHMATIYAAHHGSVVARFMDAVRGKKHGMSRAEASAKVDHMREVLAERDLKARRARVDEMKASLRDLRRRRAQLT